jgi:hypothetical protein
MPRLLGDDFTAVPDPKPSITARGRGIRGMEAMGQPRKQLERVSPLYHPHGAVTS